MRVVGSVASPARSRWRDTHDAKVAITIAQRSLWLRSRSCKVTPRWHRRAREVRWNVAGVAALRRAREGVRVRRGCGRAMQARGVQRISNFGGNGKKIEVRSHCDEFGYYSVVIASKCEVFRARHIVRRAIKKGWTRNKENTQKKLPIVSSKLGTKFRVPETFRKWCTWGDNLSFSYGRSRFILT